MPRKPSFQAREHNGKMRVWYGGRWVHLGSADDPEGCEQRRKEVLLNPPQKLAKGGLVTSDLFRWFLESADAPPRGSNQRRRYKDAGSLLGQVYGGKPVDKFGPAEFRSWSRWLCGLKNEDGELRFNRTSIRHFLGAVKRVWRWGVENRGVKAELWMALKSVGPPKPGEAREPRKVLPAKAADVDTVIPHLPPVPRAVVQLLRLSAARPSEVLVLRPCDVDRSGAVWWYRPSLHKNKHRGKDRVIAFGIEAQAVLSPWLKGLAPSHYAFTPKRNDVARGRVCKQPRSPRYDHRSLLHAVQRACDRAGVERFTSYRLRHLRGAEVRVEHGLEAARAVLGQSSLSMADYYSSGADAELAAKAAK